ncbi:MAG TPA: peptidylprolyl isomerase [Candidatus Acidoferrales bacterium]|nr:peptidylprolyl isomerase [Candidatus Acidoferrales bacterium]
MSKRHFLRAAVMGFILAAIAGCSSASSSTGGNVASVNGQDITRDAFISKLEGTQQAKNVLNQMVQSTLIDQYAKDNNIQIPDSAVQAEEDKIRARYPNGQFEMLLKQQNLTEDDVKNILREQLVLEKAVSGDVHVSDADVKSYIDKNHATLDKPEQVDARHILVADLPTAQQVEAKLKAGGNFADLAKQYSTDPSTKDKGGELGYFSRGQMVPQFEAAAFSQPIGVVGPPVKSPFGYHIIEVEGRKPGTTATFANSADTVRETLRQQQEQQLIPTFLQGLRAKANIQIFDAELQGAIPPATTPAPTVPPAATAAPAAPTSASAPSTAPSPAHT